MLVCSNWSRVKVARPGEAGQNHTPMLLAGQPAKGGAVPGIRDGTGDADAAELLAQAQAVGKCAVPVPAERK